MNHLDSGHVRVNDAINGDNSPPLVVHNGIHPKINGFDSHSHPSPATDSPATPVSTTAVPDVKIDMDYQEQESDVRHEPLPIKAIDALDKHHDHPTASHLPIPHDPSTIPNYAPKGSPPVEDVNMATSAQLNGHVNGHSDDVIMGDGDNQTNAGTPGISNDFSMTSIDGGSSTSIVRSYPDDDDHDEPPAKRARMHSDADMASTAHSATPPPASAAMSASPAPPPPSSVPPTTAGTSTFGLDSTISAQQWRFCLSTIRSLKKQKDSVPYLRPVDAVALNIPHYHSIIKTPMDFSTIERKLISTNPMKPDSNPNNPRYHTTDEFISDFRLMFQNAATFNGPEHVVTQMGRRIEAIFDKQIKHLPAPEKPKAPPIVKKVDTPPPPPPPPVAAPPAKKAQPSRRASTSVPVIRRSEAETVGRPKREIHPPPPKDLPYADAPKKHRKGKRVKDDGTAEQLKYCGKILHELHKKQHFRSAQPFYEPVDWQKMDLPTYPKLVKKPMDLSTIRKKLDTGEYPSAQKFYDDFKLMIRNCFLFNPPGTPVNLAGIELQRLFDEKWRSLPPLHEASEEEYEEEEEDDSEEERQRHIALIESQIESMRSEVANLKNPKPKEKKKKEKKEKVPVASTSKAAPVKQPKAPAKKKQKKVITDEDVLTFEQKKDLSESIGKLDGTRLERVIQIIHEGVPEIRDSTEEIELEIDQLPPAVLTKLYNFVLRPLRQPTQTKRSRTGKGTGTGGLKRKSMDEEKEAEKIRQLEERMALFEPRDPTAPLPTRRDDDSEHSSDSSSGSDSSGSDSE